MKYSFLMDTDLFIYAGDVYSLLKDDLIYRTQAYPARWAPNNTFRNRFKYHSESNSNHKIYGLSIYFPDRREFSSNFTIEDGFDKYFYENSFEYDFLDNSPWLTFLEHWVNTIPTVFSNKYIYRGVYQTTGWTKYISKRVYPNKRSQINIYWNNPTSFEDRKIKNLLDPDVIDNVKYYDILCDRSVSEWFISESTDIEIGPGYRMEMDNSPDTADADTEVDPLVDRIENLFVYDKPEIFIDDKDSDNDNDIEMSIIKATNTHNVSLYENKVPKFMLKNDKAGPIKYHIESENQNIHIKFRKTTFNNAVIHFDAVDTLTGETNLENIYIHLYFENDNGESYLVPPLPEDIIAEPGKSSIVDPDIIPTVPDEFTLPEWLWDDIVIIPDTTTITEEIEIYTYDGNGDYIGHDTIDCRITIN